MRQWAETRFGGATTASKLYEDDSSFEIATGYRHWLRAARVMRRFEYFRDPMFLVAAASYALNRWLLKPLLPFHFLHWYFNDVLLLPAALPVVLWLQRRLGLRRHDEMPSWSEMALHLAIWSVICECIGPRWLHRGTADIWDVFAYAVGGVLACLWWNRSWQLNSPRAS